MEKEEALNRFSSSRQALFDAIASLSESDFTSPQVEGIWTIKDLLGHITAWEQSLREPLRVYSTGGPFVSQIVSDGEAWNLEQASRRSSWSISEIRNEMEITRQDLLDELQKLSKEQWGTAFLAPWGDSNTVTEMISGLAWHEEEHTKSILKFLAK